MSYKLIHQLKKEVSVEIKKEFKKHMIVGDDLMAALMFKRLKDAVGDNIHILSNKPITKEAILPMGPSLVRGEENLKVLKEFYPEASIKEYEQATVFYKEMKFRPFGGRAKSEALLHSEEFFIDKRTDLDILSLFPFLNDEQFYKDMEAARMDMTIAEVRKTTPEDLVDQAFFQVVCTNGLTVECEHLYWCQSPQMFLNFYNEKSELSDDFIQLSEETRSPCAVYVQFTFEEAITDREETLFIPLSYTHDWGHFVGEIKTNSDGLQVGEFVTFVVPEESSEEDISRIIRLLKRNLEKIFEKLKKVSYTEFIKLAPSSACLKIDDRLFTITNNEMKNLYWASVNAPLERLDAQDSSCEDSKISPTCLVRGLESVRNIRLKA